jgi:SAM-dependent methyltransferase
MISDLPLPPLEFRRLVGPTDPAAFENAAGAPVFSEVPLAAYASILDFGCGCGRIARQLLQQQPQPAQYLGLDRHAGMIAWCREHLSAATPHFAFAHHDVFHPHLNSHGTPGPLALPVEAEAITLFIAWSVFTHLLQPDAEFYLREVGRILGPEGVAVTTWFLFDKADFPMMQDFQNALFINTVDPTNAVIFDRAWLSANVRDAGLVMTRIVPPAVRGFQWTIHLARRTPGREDVAFPEDVAPRGIVRAPLG